MATQILFKNAKPYIPVVHNLSEYGLKWNNINDIINYINFYHKLL